MKSAKQQPHLPHMSGSDRNHTYRSSPLQTTTTAITDFVVTGTKSSFDSQDQKSELLSPREASHQHIRNIQLETEEDYESPDNEYSSDDADIELDEDEEDDEDVSNIHGTTDDPAIDCANSDDNDQYENRRADVLVVDQGSEADGPGIEKGGALNSSVTSLETAKAHLLRLFTSGTRSRVGSHQDLVTSSSVDGTDSTPHKRSHSNLEPSEISSIASKLPQISVLAPTHVRPDGNVALPASNNVSPASTPRNHEATRNSVDSSGFQSDSAASDSHPNPSDRPRHSYLQMIGFPFRSGKAEKRQEKSMAEGSSDISTQTRLHTPDDETSSSGPFRKSTRKKVHKKVASEFIHITTKNKSYVELSRLKKIQLIPAGSGMNAVAPSSASVGGASVGSTATNAGGRAISVAETETEMHHIPVVGPVLAMRFSKGGKFLATGGVDTIVRVFVVSSKAQDTAAKSMNGSIRVGTMSKSDSIGTANAPRLPSYLQKNSDDGRVSDRLSQIPRRQSSENSMITVDSLSLNTTGNNGAKISGEIDTFKQVISPIAFRTFCGHTGPILDISWSKSNFLLSSSSDKTVRMWHTLRVHCLKVFTHDHAVNAVRFHPKNDQVFISVSAGGTQKSRLRVWNVGQKRVVNWLDISTKSFHPGSQPTSLQGEVPPASAAVYPNAGGLTPNAGLGQVGNSASYFVTAMEVSADGSLVITGTSEGSLYFHEFTDQTLRYNTRVDMTPQTNIKAFRVTGIETLGGLSDEGIGPDMSFVEDSTSPGSGIDGYVLVTATDGRVRLFNLRDKSLVRRYRGPDIRSLGFIKAVGSSDGRFAICGSEKGTVHVWDLDANSFANRGVLTDIASAAADLDDKKRMIALEVSNLAGGGYNSSAGKGFFSGLMQWQTDQTRYGESFRACDWSITCAVFAPANVRNILALSSAEDHRSMASSLSGAFIVVADIIGNILVFENQLPNHLQDKGGASSSIPTPALPLESSSYEKKDIRPNFVSSKRIVSAPATTGNGLNYRPASAAISTDSSVDYSPVSTSFEPPRFDYLDKPSYSPVSIDPFSADVVFLAKEGTKSEVSRPITIPSIVTTQPHFDGQTSSQEVVPGSNLQLRKRSFSTNTPLVPTFAPPRTGSAPLDPSAELKMLEPSKIGQNPKQNPKSASSQSSTPPRNNLIESLLPKRSHARTVSTPKAGSESDSSPLQTQNPPTRMAGIFGRKRGATSLETSHGHNRSATAPTSLSPDSPILVAPVLTSAISRPSRTALDSPQIAQLPHIESGKSSVSLMAPAIERSKSYHSMMGAFQAQVESRHPVELGNSSGVGNDEVGEPLTVCKTCGGSNFLLTKSKKLICSNCKTLMDL